MAYSIYVWAVTRQGNFPQLSGWIKQSCWYLTSKMENNFKFNKQLEKDKSIGFYFQNEYH